MATHLLDSLEKGLLEKFEENRIPSYRQAYSDRTAWFMAVLSGLVYEPFNKVDLEETNQFLQDKLKALLDKKTKHALSEVVMSIYHRDAEETAKNVSAVLGYEISVERIYDKDGTQAFLVSTNDYLALVFRGTEANSFTDIKTDLDAVITQCPSGGRVHSGFSKAFDLVGAAIQSDLDQAKYSDKPLIIAGHSLGAALATIACKRLTHKGGIAACYTFGSPRVVDEEWTYTVKTPIYRVVNAVDCVTMMPPDGLVIDTIKTLISLIPYFGKPVASFLLSRFQGYHHVGDMRYLTSCKPGQYENVELLNNVSIFRRFQAFSRSKVQRKFVKDHSILVYRKKLAQIAFRRSDF